MKDAFSLGILIVTFLLDWGAAKKHHIGPCLIVIEPEPCPDPEYIQLYLYTRSNKDKEQYVEVSATKDNLTSSNFNPKNPNKIIIHGFNADMYLDVLQDIKTEYLTNADVNVWMVNYPKLVENAWCYLAAAIINIKHVGICLAQLIRALRQHQSDDIHVIGFSLGAQVANYLANTLGSKKLDRITGLDPAGPGFTLRGKTHRLDADDAKFVDVVHTNGGIQGDIQRCGDIDFYMNGGVSQPGCFENKDDYLNCNHRRAPQYFAESINTRVGFLGWPCKSFMDYLQGKCKPTLQLVPMGEHVPTGSSGLYVVETASNKPFALGNWTSKYYKNNLPTLMKNKEQTVSINNPKQRIFLDIYITEEGDTP